MAEGGILEQTRLSDECELSLSSNEAPENDDNILQSSQTPTKAGRQCPLHTNKPIKWYCKSHDVLTCDFCKVAIHRKCHVISVVDISADIFESNGFTKVKVELTNLKEEFSSSLANVRKNVDEVANMYKKVLEEVTKTLTDIRNRDMELLKSVESTCDASLSIVTGLINDLETMETRDDKVDAFLTKRQVEGQVKTFDETLKAVKEDNLITKYRFVSSPEPYRCGLIGTICDQDYRVSPVKLGDINVKLSSDNSTCFITGFDKLDDERMVLADMNNKKLKLIDRTTELVCAELQLHVSPWDVTKIDGETLAVTTYLNTSILIVSITDSFQLSAIKTIEKRKFWYCLGIVYDNDLIVSYNVPSRIEIMDLDGCVKKTVENKNKDNKIQFEGVDYIAKNADANTLYLSDNKNDKILSMTRDGEFMQSFTHEHLKNPRGITVGKNGRVFVCSNGSNMIYEMASDLSKGKSILCDSNGIKDPWSIFYDTNEHRLYIGRKSNTIQIFLV